MGSERYPLRFSEEYGQFRGLRAAAREEPLDPVPEHVLQCVWYDQLFADADLRADNGRALKVLSPGWWNHGEGPDFKGAQIEFNGALRTGDVEVHLNHAAWSQHGHHLDERYNEVILVVALESDPPSRAPLTASGRPIPSLLLSRYLEEDIRKIADGLLIEDYPYRAGRAFGQCSEVVQTHGPDPITRLLTLAGEWRILSKARLLREQMERVGPDQALYETFLTACGYSHFKHHFRAIAQQFHYARVRQLGREDPLLLEAAFLQIAGLLPENLPPGSSALPHFARLRAYRRDRLAGLKSLPLTWHRVGVRPTNNPERRLAGAARFLSRTADRGLADTLEAIWRQADDANLSPRECRQTFEDLFPAPLGFWATHCTWTGKTLKAPVALLGSGRVRSIIGNAFIPAALAIARQHRDRIREEHILNFFSHLPQEPDNQVLKVMRPRMFGPEAARAARVPLDFRLQQGLLQLHQDWCATNPSCHNCSVIRLLAPTTPPY